jgi:lysozyme
MSQVDMNLMVQELTRDEGQRLLVYDDANGNEVKAGYTLVGNPTIGVGRDLSSYGVTSSESAYLLGNNIQNTIAELDAQLSWWENLDPVRQRVMVNMAFNMGIEGLEEFPMFLAAMQAGNWTAAGQDMEQSHWWNEVGERAVRLQYMVLNGTVQPGSI